jgi:hypothetical protein
VIEFEVSAFEIDQKVLRVVIKLASLGTHPHFVIIAAHQIVRILQNMVLSLIAAILIV